MRAAGLLVFLSFIFPPKKSNQYKSQNSKKESISGKKTGQKNSGIQNNKQGRIKRAKSANSKNKLNRRPRISRDLQVDQEGDFLRARTTETKDQKLKTKTQWREWQTARYKYLSSWSLDCLVNMWLPKMARKQTKAGSKHTRWKVGQKHMDTKTQSTCKHNREIIFGGL